MVVCVVERDGVGNIADAVVIQVASVVVAPVVAAEAIIPKVYATNEAVCLYRVLDEVVVDDCVVLSWWKRGCSG